MQFLTCDHKRGTSTIAFLEKSMKEGDNEQLSATFIECRDPFKKVAIDNLDQFYVSNVKLPKDMYK